VSLLEEVVGDLVREGFVHSQGQFSLDVQSAREKLANFSLADPYHWVLKMAQAATLLGCKDLQVRVSPQELTLRFEGMKVAYADFRDGMESLTLSSKDPAARGLNHLSQALHSLRQLRWSRLVIRAAQPENSYVFDGVHLWERPTDRGWAGDPMVTLGLQRGLSLFQREWPEIEMLRRRAHLAPFGIWVGGRLVPKVIQPVSANSWLSLLVGPSAWTHQAWINPGRRLDPRTMQRLKAESAGSQATLLQVDANGKFSPLDRTERNGEADGMMCWVAGARPPGRLYFWLDGVLSDPVALPETACHAVLDQGPVAVDLSGLRVVENQHLHQRAAWLSEVLQSMQQGRTRGEERTG
jgi:hypothetical protein